MGLKEVNKNAYLQLREYYNKGEFDQHIAPLIFYILIVYGFNNQIRFNKDNYFNTPVGKRDFNVRMESKLKSFIKRIEESVISTIQIWTIENF